MLTPLKAWVRTDSFHAVLSERSGRWYNACLRITRDADLAADAVQEALKAWDRRDEFRGESDLDTWIHRIALNAAIDLMRRRKPQAADESTPSPWQRPLRPRRARRDPQASRLLARPAARREGAEITSSVMFNDKNADVREQY